MQQVKAATPEGEKMPQATQLAQEASKAYKQLTPDEMEVRAHSETFVELALTLGLMQDLKREWQVKHDQYKKALQNVTDQLSSLDIKNENKYRTAQRKAGKSRKGNLMQVNLPVPCHCMRTYIPSSDPSKPKHPRSAYLQYYIEQIASPEWSGQPVTNVSKLVAEQWRDLNDDEKSVCRRNTRAWQDWLKLTHPATAEIRQTG